MASDASSYDENKRCQDSLLDDHSRRVSSDTLRQFESFLREQDAYKTASKTDKTNIIDQQGKKTWAFPELILSQFMEVYDKCRREGNVMHFSEKQQYEGKLESGIMLDFDCKFREANPEPARTIRLRIIEAVMEVIAGTLFAIPKGAETKVAWIERPSFTQITDSTGTVFKRGFHLLVPGICLTRPHKKYIIHKLRNDTRVGTALREFGVIDGEKSLDENSASVPVLFLGSCKSGSVICYKLVGIYQVELRYIRPQEMLDIKDEPYILDAKATEERNKPKYNLAYELSLTGEMKGGNKLIPKVVYKPVPELEIKIGEYGARSVNGRISDEEIFIAENEVDALVRSSPEALHIQGLLSLLSMDYCSDRTKWRNVIYALANSSNSRICYKPLAVWFSQKCPEKWKAGGEMALNQLWDEAKVRSSNNGDHNILTMKSIDYWARTCDPDRHTAITRDGYFAKLQKYVYDCRGTIENAMVSDILHSLLRHKFCVDYEGKIAVWYEFITDKDHGIKSGEIWKWRKEPCNPISIQDYMTKELPGIYNRAIQIISDRRQKAESKEKAKYFTEIYKALEKSRLRLYQNTFKNNTIKECVNNFIHRGFTQKLDVTCPNIFGVKNGILVMSRNTIFIDHFHEYPVSKYTTVEWKGKFNPLAPDPIQSKLLGMIADIIIEKDARIKLMMALSTGLVGGSKSLPLIILKGNARNGKSVLMSFMRQTLGSMYSTDVDPALYTSKIDGADKPNSALMTIKGMNFSKAEESVKGEVLNTVMLKKLIKTFGLSARELHKPQENVQITATQFFCTNFEPEILTMDDGTWRRVQLYIPRTKFMPDPDPNSEFEVKGDEKFESIYPNDPNYQTAWLQILVYFYEWFLNEYNGIYDSIPSPTIDRTTEEYRNEHDHVNRFISKFVVYSPKNATKSPDSALINIAYKYQSWCETSRISCRLSPDNICKIFADSSLVKQLRRIDGGNEYETFGIRVMDQKDSLQEGERYYKPMIFEPRQHKKDRTPNWWIPERKESKMGVSVKIENEVGVEEISCLDDDKQYVNVKSQAAADSLSLTPNTIPNSSNGSDILDDLFQP